MYTYLIHIVHIMYTYRLSVDEPQNLPRVHSVPVGTEKRRSTEKHI